MTTTRADDGGLGPRGEAEAAPADLSASGTSAMPSSDEDEDATPSPVPLAVVRAAGEARDPRMKGIVLSRMFGRAVEPQRIGRFTLLGRLGEGGMGVVYAAYDDRLDRKVAVKVLRSMTDDAAAMRRGRLLQEARALARLSHPNIVTVHEVGLDGDDVFVAMEHVRGQSLDRWLEGSHGEGRSWRAVVEVLVAAGRGLSAAHRAGMVHRDFKPHNVIVGEDGAVKVLDFGLARVPGVVAPRATAPWAEAESSAALTRTGAVVGTPAYMAPEQHEGRAVDERSDQFAFFVTLYLALYREMPFPSGSVAQLGLAYAEGKVPTPPPGSAVPRWLERAVLVGLSIDPERRYSTMDAALAALTRDPASARRRALALGGLLALVSGGSGAIALAWSRPPVEACDGGRVVMEQGWGGPARARVRSGLLASGLPHAEQTWARLEPRLDGHAEAWARAWDDTCRARRDASMGGVVAERRAVCLELRRASFEALVELLGGADREAAERSVEAAAALPSVASCLGAGALAEATAPPGDPALALEVGVERRRLARVAGLEALGRHGEGLEEARRVIAEAERLGYRPLLAEALVRAGSLAMESAAPDEAERQLSRALGHALATDHVDVAVEALARRIFVRAERMRTPERAADDVAAGASLLERLRGDPRLRSLYLNNVGAYHIRREEPDEARRVLERALEAERSLDPDDPALVKTLGNLAIAEERAGRDEVARERMAEALAHARRTLGPYHPATVELVRAHAEVSFHAGHARAAEAALLEVVEALGEIAEPRSPLHHAPLVVLGELALEERRYADAQAWFERAAALELGRAGGGEMYRVLEDAGLSRAWWGQGEQARGRAGLERVAARAEGSDAPYAAALLVLYGRTLLLHGQPEDALGPLRRAIALEERQGHARSPQVTLARIAEGQALARLGRLDQAEAALADAQAQLPDPSQRRERAWVLVERSHVARAGGQRARALAFAREGVALIEAWGEPEHPERARAWSALVLALREGSPTEAERREADALAQEVRRILAPRGEAFAAELRALEDAPVAAASAAIPPRP